MLVGIVTNETKDCNLAYTSQVQAFLTQKGTKLANSATMHDANFWVVLGGDGTMLRAAQTASKYDIPLIGINLGTVGFLTDVERSEGLHALSQVLDNNYKMEKRLMLDIMSDAGKHTALNDVIIGTTGGLKHFDISVNGQHLDTVRCDGVLVATPTGSTAYNLSANGPILIPGGNMFVVTPICPHSLSARPLVVGASDIVTITPHQATHLNVDGSISASTSASISIKKAPVYTSIIKTTNVDFHTVLRVKKLI